MTDTVKNVKTSELYSCDIPFLVKIFDESIYPWEILPRIEEIIDNALKTGLEGYHYLTENVLIGDNVKISPSATIEGKAIIGNNTQIRPSAYLRGNVIAGDECVIGNSSELKNSILLRHVEVPHYNYVGDSILGNYSHMGAGSVCSNLRSDGANVIIHGDREYTTGLRKIGAFLADRGDVGCGCVLNPGSVIGRGTSVYPLTMVRGVTPPSSIVKSMDDIVKRI